MLGQPYPLGRKKAAQICVCCDFGRTHRILARACQHFIIIIIIIIASFSSCDKAGEHGHRGLIFRNFVRTYFHGVIDITIQVATPTSAASHQVGSPFALQTSAPEAAQHGSMAQHTQFPVQVLCLTYF